MLVQGVARCVAEIMQTVKAAVPDAFNFVMDQVLNQTVVPDIEVQLEMLCTAQNELQKVSDDLTEQIKKFGVVIGKIEEQLALKLCPVADDIKKNLNKWKENLVEKKKNLGLDFITTKINSLNDQKISSEKMLKDFVKIKGVTT